MTRRSSRDHDGPRTYRHLGLVVVLAVSLFGVSAPAYSDDFTRGDANADGGIDISDTVFLLTYLMGDNTLDCLDAADNNDDGEITIGDAVYQFYQLFSTSGPPFLPPGPGTCGTDPTTDVLDCVTFSICP